MQNCPFCGSELPLNARFCGNCGRARSSITAIDSVTHVRNSPPPDVEPRVVSTASSASPPPLDEEKVEQLVKIPTRPLLSQEQQTELSHPPVEEEEEERRRAILPDIFFPGRGGPSAGNTPMVQGTPQMHGVSAVQSFPQGAPSSAPPAFEPSQALRSVATTSKVTSGSAVKTLSIILAGVVVLGTVAVYLLTRPQPVIDASSNYKVGSTLAGAIGTVFHLRGHKFSGASVITFLLDDQPVPGNTVVHSDTDGNVKADLVVTSGWALGRHILTARDASNYTTRSGVTVLIVLQGQANTLGPHGAPPDDASFKLNIKIQGQDSSGQPFGGQQTLVITGHPDPAGGTVCEAGITGKPYTFNSQTLNNATPYRATVTYACGGTYKGGKLSYTRTTVSGTAVVFDSSVTSTCVLNAPVVDEQLQGTFSGHNTFSGTFNFPKVTSKCDVQGAEFFRDASTGTWTGQVVVS